MKQNLIVQTNIFRKPAAIFFLILGAGLLAVRPLCAQDDDLLKLVNDNSAKKDYVTGAFKSSRVINGHSMEFIGKGVLDVRILHRFGTLDNGFKTFFGLDQASMRMGFDYGLGKSLTAGVGRSSVNKELDAFFKYRPVWQSAGSNGFPFSIVLVAGATLNTLPWEEEEKDNKFSSRWGYFGQVIFGRKFSEAVSLQLSPVFVHRNMVTEAEDDNDTYALGIGGRLKLTKRTAFVIDYHPILAGRQKDTKDPFSVGFDIQTGGHVFQLHFSNSAGMNEKEFITNTRDDFWKGEIRFGFNLSRVFTVNRRKVKNIESGNSQ